MLERVDMPVVNVRGQHIPSLSLELTVWTVEIHNLPTIRLHHFFTNNLTWQGFILEEILRFRIRYLVNIHQMFPQICSPLSLVFTFFTIK